MDNTEKIKVGDIDMCYSLMGEGPPLVMIMGLTANMDWWDKEFLRELSESHRLLLLDNRGAGRTQAPPEGDFEIGQFARDTAGLMDAVGFERADVLGVSMGGMIAQELALTYPEKVNRLVLVVTNCGGRESVLASREVLSKLMDRSGTREELVRRFLGIIFPPGWLVENQVYFDDFMERYLLAPCSDHDTARQFMATVRFSTFDRLPDIKAPTLIVTGSEDLLIPPENSRIIAERIAGSRLVELEGAGHGAINQCREEFLEVLAGFLG